MVWNSACATSDGLPSRRSCALSERVCYPINNMVSLRSKWAAGKAVRAGLAVEGAYLDRYVTDEQRSRRPIFIATLRAVASWLFFCVARSTRMNQIWALRSRLEKQPTDRRRKQCYLWDSTLVASGFRCYQNKNENRQDRESDPLTPGLTFPCEEKSERRQFPRRFVGYLFL